MNRRWIVVAALGLCLGGCAEGVDGPLPPPGTPPEQPAGSADTLSGDISGDDATTVDFEAPPLYLPTSELHPVPEPGN